MKRFALAALPAVLVGGAIVWAVTLPPAEVRLSGFATRLTDRSPAQRYNAKLSAQVLNGAVVPAGATFSFNKRVKSWSADRGYVKAPVSYDGDMVPAYGGGVCQTSTTLYNTALLAGMTVNERHHHVFAPHYVTPGRDAAVAYPSIDLRFTNPYSFPVRIRAKTTGDRLEVSLWGARPPKTAYQLASTLLNAEKPMGRTRGIAPEPGQSDLAKTFIRNPGAAGFRVLTYRVTLTDGRETKRERLSDDAYPAMPRTVQWKR